MNRPIDSLLQNDGPRLHGLLYRMTLRNDVAADLLQELFVRLCDSPGLATADNPSAYARRVAINLALEWRRRRRITASLNGAALATSLPSMLDSLAQAEDLERVLDALAQLPSEASKQCFVLRYLEQQSYETVARGMGKTAHQVRGLCHAAVRQIRGLVGADERTRGERQVANG